jgi:RHS repeat-associated protein
VEVAFAGRPFESRTGLSDNRARWYEPATGRFVNEDPSGFKGGDANLFRYVGNDPLNQVDPSGLAAIRTSGAKTSVPAAGWAALGQGAMLATSGSRLSSVSATPTPPASTLVLPHSRASNDSQPQSPAASPAATPSQPFSSLMTTGKSAPAVPQASRWTVQDREAASRSDLAYMLSSGGLLNDMKVGYDAKDSANKYTSTGMSAMLTRSPRTGVYYLAFRGTETAPTDRRDVQADVDQFLGGRTMQYEKAIELAKLVKDKVGPDAEIHLTGHSLGGGLAAAAAYATGLKATVFNPASISRRYAQGTPGEIRSHVIVGDPLSIGRTFQNALFAPNVLLGGQRERELLPPLLTAPGTIILHPPRSANTHGMHNYPDFRIIRDTKQ